MHHRCFAWLTTCGRMNGDGLTLDFESAGEGLEESRLTGVKSGGMGDEPPGGISIARWLGGKGLQMAYGKAYHLTLT